MRHILWAARCRALSPQRLARTGAVAQVSVGLVARGEAELVLLFGAFLGIALQAL